MLIEILVSNLFHFKLGEGLYAEELIIGLSNILFTYVVLKP